MALHGLQNGKIFLLVSSSYEQNDDAAFVDFFVSLAHLTLLF